MSLKKYNKMNKTIKIYLSFHNLLDDSFGFIQKRLAFILSFFFACFSNVNDEN